MRNLFLLYLQLSLVLAPGFAQTQDDIPVVLSPNKGVRGKSYLLTVRPKGACEPAKLSLKDAAMLSNLGAPEYKVKDQDCAWAAQVGVAGDAPYGSNDVVLTLKDGRTFLLPFTVSDITPGPVHPEIDEKDRVDVNWKVLPRRVVSDSFGVRVAKLYYGVEVVIGNNSGYDLQIASINFRLPVETGLDTAVPTDAYRIVRGSLEQASQIGFRNTAINIIKGVGPVLTGANYFFFNSNHQGRYNALVGIFSNPFEKGLELVFPDLTVHQMAALDNQTLRDGTIIPNNVQQRVLVFLSRDTLLRNQQDYFRLLALKRKAQLCPAVITTAPPPPPPADAKPVAGAKPARAARKSPVNPALGSTTDNVCKDNLDTVAARLRDSLDTSAGNPLGFGKHEFDPQEVMRQLGELVIVGKSIQYVNRLSIVANKDNIGVPIPPTAFPPNHNEAWPGNDVVIQISGNALDGAQLTSDTPGISTSEGKIGTGGTTASWKITVDKAVTVTGDVNLRLTTRGGSTNVPFRVKKLPEVTAPAISLPTTGSRKVTLTGSGLEVLQGVAITPADSNLTLALSDQSPGGASAVLTITAKNAQVAGHEISFTAKDGSKLPIKSPPRLDVIDPPVVDKMEPAAGAAGADTTVKLTGKALDAVTGITATGGLVPKKDVASPDGTSLNVTITVPAGTAKGDYDVTVTPPGKKLKFTVQ